MKKLVLFATYVVGIVMMLSDNALAVSTVVGGTCPNGQVWCSVYAIAGEGCCIPQGTLCTKDSCGGGSTIIVACKGLECAGKTTWSDYGTGGAQIKCSTLTEDGVCEYRCNPDGYYRSSIAENAGIRCEPCPEHATCTGGPVPCCNLMYYPEKSTAVYPGLTGQVTTYQCLKCPSYRWYSDDTSSMGITMYGMTPPNVCVGSITACYIPEGTHSGDKTGRFQIVNNNCNYVE